MRILGGTNYQITAIDTIYIACSYRCTSLQVLSDLNSVFVKLSLDLLVEICQRDCHEPDFVHVLQYLI
jgi:hypothetical protein